ncbi:hypothetical protein [Paracoccus sp. PARArs4]|uniref:hypothetical protein n=1 Tax=Paracoccus sp. PARArs4 TaxID=2853442 RepID=UPI0024A794FA|nr:hypothetical protein [Paracoccus sp. PARArs4]
MQLAKQLSAMPTNKLLTGGGVAAVVSAAWAEVMPSMAPALAGPAVGALVGALAAYAVAYWVPDRVNLPR